MWYFSPDKLLFLTSVVLLQRFENSKYYLSWQQCGFSQWKPNITFVSSKEKRAWPFPTIKGKTTKIIHSLWIMDKYCESTR